MLPSDSLRKMILVAALLFLVGISGSAIAEPSAPTTTDWTARVVGWLEDLNPASLLSFAMGSKPGEVVEEPTPQPAERPRTELTITRHSDVAPGFDPNG